MTSELLSAIRFMSFHKLLSDVEKRHYDRIQKLWIAANLKNADLLELLNEVHSYDVPPEESVFNDMCFILAERIPEDSELLALFQELYKIRFGQSVEDPKRLAAIEKGWNYFRHGTFTKDAEKTYSFGDGEPVFQSRAFENYIKARREDLARLHGIDEKDLVSFYHSNLRPSFVMAGDDMELIRFSKKDMFFGTAYATTANFLNSHCGAEDWLRAVMFAKNEYLEKAGVRRKGWDYLPDFDKILYDYYRGKVASFIQTLQDSVPFTRPMLRYDCADANPYVDHVSICCFYYTDIIFEFFRRMQTRYYTDFSWEAYSGKTLQQLYSAQLDESKKLINRQAEQIQALEAQNKSLAASSQSSLAETERQLRHESDGLRKELMRKDDEIRLLKERLAWQESLTDEALAEPDDSSSSECDRTLIHTKRYLFVGFPEAVSEIRKEFPGSAFMTSEASQISGMQVDAIVLLIRAMKHKFFYKIRSEKSLSEVPVIYCNGTGMDAVYAAIWKSADYLFPAES